MTQNNETKLTRRAILKQGALAVSVLLLAGSGLLAGCGGSGNHDDEIPTNTSDRSNPLSSMTRITSYAGTNAEVTSAYQCWLAVTPSQRSEALSWVSDAEMPAGAGKGMAIIYPSNQILSYSARSTPIDLDVVYAVGGGAPGVGRICDIGVIPAFSHVPLVSSEPAQFVLMVRRGDLARSGAKVGDYLFIPAVTPSK